MAATEKTDIFKDFLLSNHQEFVKKLNGNNTNAITQKRKEAMLDFAKVGFPTTAHEEWKYTNLAHAWKHEFTVSPGSNLTIEQIQQFLLPDFSGNSVVLINGVLQKKFSSILEADSVLEIKSFAEVDSEVLEKYFHYKAAAADSFLALNTAYADKGVFIRVLPGKELKYPVVIYNINDGIDNKPFSSIRNLIIAEAHSRLTLVDHYVSVGDNTSFVNSFCEFHLQKDAQVDYYQLQNEGPEVYHVGTTEVIHQEASSFSGTTVTLGGKLVRNNFNIRLNAERSEAYLNGLFLTEQKRHVDNHTVVDHAKANCYSNELYKGILSDQSTGVFNGKIFVREQAQKTNAFQSNKNILLSPEATMNTKPQLEIFADDVKCSHGATVGQLDTEPLFYLRSRGLSEKSAVAMLTLAFAHDVIDRIKLGPLKEHVRKLVTQKLQK